MVCYVAYTAEYLTYLLKSTEVIQSWEFDNLHMAQCAKIIVGFMANVGNVFYPTFTNVFFYFLHVFHVFNVFFNFHLNVYYIYERVYLDRVHRLPLRAAGYSPTGGQRPVHVGARAGGSGILVDDEDRDAATGQHQSATAAAAAAAAAVRKTCLTGSHTSTPWRPQGKLPSRCCCCCCCY